MLLLLDRGMTSVRSAMPEGEAPRGAQVLERIKEPLQTLMSRDQYETAYAVLAHFLLLAQRAPSLFSQARRLARCAPRTEGRVLGRGRGAVAYCSNACGGALGTAARMVLSNRESV